jgi:large subunit ribosomal protein L35
MKRFKHLDWGIWIRTIAGRKKRIWKKSQYQRYRARQHVFTNATQSNMLDKMTTKYWKKPKNWVDDVYEPYQTRESFRSTRRKPIEWD